MLASIISVQRKRKNLRCAFYTFCNVLMFIVHVGLSMKTDTAWLISKRCAQEPWNGVKERKRLKKSSRDYSPPVHLTSEDLNWIPDGSFEVCFIVGVLNSNQTLVENLDYVASIPTEQRCRVCFMSRTLSTKRLKYTVAAYVTDMILDNNHLCTRQRFLTIDHLHILNYALFLKVNSCTFCFLW